MPNPTLIALQDIYDALAIIGYKDYYYINTGLYRIEEAIENTIWNYLQVIDSDIGLMQAKVGINHSHTLQGVGDAVNINIGQIAAINTRLNSLIIPDVTSLEIKVNAMYSEWFGGYYNAMNTVLTHIHNINDYLDGTLLIDLHQLDSDIDDIWVKIDRDIDPRLVAVEDTVYQINNVLFGGYYNIINTVLSHITNINEYLNGALLLDLQQLDGDIDAIWVKIDTDIDPRLLSLENDIALLKNGLFTNIELQYPALFALIDDKISTAISYEPVDYNQIQKMIDDSIALITIPPNTDYETIGNMIASAINNIDIPPETDYNLINSMIIQAVGGIDLSQYVTFYELQTIIEIAISRINIPEPTDYDRISLEINTAIADIRALLESDYDNKIAMLESNINEEIQGLSDSITAIEARLSVDEDIAVNDYVVPLTLLYAVLNDKNGIYSDYRQYWQLFATKIIS